MKVKCECVICRVERCDEKVYKEMNKRASNLLVNHLREESKVSPGEAITQIVKVKKAKGGNVRC